MARNWQKFVQITVGTLFCAQFLLTGCAERQVLIGSESDSKKTAQRAVKAELVTNSAEIWFVKPGSQDFEYVKVNRQLNGKDKLESAIAELLHGPTGEEEGQGLASEIPKGTILLGVTPLDDDYEINLSRRFASSGGGASMEARMEQLKRTVAAVVGDHKVFLNVEGKRLVASSDGLEIQQPINF